MSHETQEGYPASLLHTSSVTLMILVLRDMDSHSQNYFGLFLPEGIFPRHLQTSASVLPIGLKGQYATLAAILQVPDEFRVCSPRPLCCELFVLLQIYHVAEELPAQIPPDENAPSIASSRANILMLLTMD